METFFVFHSNYSDSYKHSRVKSLSKGNSSRRDALSSSSNLRESTALPLYSALPTKLLSDDNVTDLPSEKNRFGWAKQIDREPSPHSNLDRVPSGRAEGNFPPSVHSDYYKSKGGDQYNIAEDDYDYSEETYEQEKSSYNKTFENNQTLALEERWKTDAVKKRRDSLAFEANNSHSDNDLNALLKVIILKTSIYVLQSVIQWPNEIYLHVI